MDRMARGSHAGETVPEAQAAQRFTPAERVTVDGEGSVAPEGGSDGGGSKEFNQSLARLEMNSLEVKHFLDSIEQRISRMEPRLDEIRGVGDRPPTGDATQPRAEAEDVSGVQDSPTGFREAPGFHDPASPPGTTTERRRKAQGLPVERRRAPHAVPVASDEEKPWDKAEMLAFVRRRWMPLAVAAALVLAVLASVSFRGRSRSSALVSPDDGNTGFDGFSRQAAEGVRGYTAGIDGAFRTECAGEVGEKQGRGGYGACGGAGCSGVLRPGAGWRAGGSGRPLRERCARLHSERGSSESGHGRCGVTLDERSPAE